MARNKKIKKSAHYGKAVGLWRNQHGTIEHLEGIIVGYERTATGYYMLISQDGFFKRCKMDTVPGCWMHAWVGKKPDQPKMDDLPQAKPRERVDPTPSDYFEEDNEGLTNLDLQLMAENIKKKRGPGRPPKAKDNGPVDLRFGMDERPDDLFDLTAGLSLGIGLEDDAYGHFSLEVAELY